MDTMISVPLAALEGDHDSDHDLPSGPGPGPPRRCAGGATQGHGDSNTSHGDSELPSVALAC